MLFSLLLTSSAYSNKYGEFKLWDNYGGVYYDYSNNGNHGYNGNQVKADSNDAIQTDRGAYFDGSSMFVTLHDEDVFGGPNSISADSSAMIWVMALSIGPIIHRFSVSFIQSSQVLYTF